MADLDTVKVVLRSLVMSSKRPMSTYDLQKDYRSNEGHECPYVALGYRNFVSFLESIPDTVRILPGGTVTAVATQETQHIARLVALQKPTKPRPRRSCYPSSYGQRSSSYSRPPRSQYSSSSYRPPRSYSSSSYETASRTSSTYTAAGRTNSSYGASSSTNSSYRALSSTNSSYRAPSSTNSSYRAPSSICEQTSSSRPYNRNDAVENFFEKVREVKGKAREEELLSNSLSVSRTTTPTPTEPGWSGEAFITDWMRKQHAENAVEDSQSRSVNYCPERFSSDEESDDSFYERFKDEEDCGQGQYKPQPVKPETAKSDLYFQSSRAINDNLKVNLRNIIRSYPDGLWACVLPEKYEEKYGVSLEWSELGYDSVVQMVHDLQDIIVCKRVQSGDWKLYDASLPLPVENDAGTKDTAPTSCVSDTVKSKIFDVVKKYTSGIRADQLVELYHEHYSRSLVIDAPGFDCAESLLFSIDGTVIRLRYIRGECYVLPGEPLLIEPAVEMSTDDKKELGFYPTEVMGPKETYLPPQLPDNLQPGSYLELMVAEVYNPFKLWVMLREMSVQLDKMMDELQDFYKDHGDKYIMPDSTITEMQCCTAVYDGEWHRAVIKSVGKMIEVFYVDYGTIATVSKKELRFIHRDFSVLPAQAIQSSLSGIQPLNGKQSFTREANQALLGLVADKHLIGLVQRIEPEKPFLELFLIDTNGDTDIHLNDVLVNQNHAMFKPELLSNDISEPQKIEEKSKPEESSPPTPTQIKSQVPTQPVSIGSTQQPCAATQLPPPGFGATVVPPVAQPGISQFNNVNTGFNAMFNQSVPAYPSTYLTQMNAALLLQQQQQQQQQAYLLAYYQNMYQQSLLNLQAAQSRMAAASGSPATNPWLGSCVPNTSAYYPSASNLPGSPANTYAHESIFKTRYETGVPSDEKDNSNREAATTVPSPTIPNAEELKQAEKRSEGKSTPRSLASSFTGVMPSENMNILSEPSECIRPRRLTPMSDSSSSSSISDIVVEHLDGHDSDSSILSCSSSYCNVAPDLVQSVANLSMYSHSATNYWKVEDVCQQDIHIFNLDQKAYVSMGELARKFTMFSTSDSLLRVLKSKGISPELKKITRQDKLSLFSSLDGCAEEFPKSFDLSRNKKGNVVGTFHLCPLSNVPAVLIPLGTAKTIISGFRKLRDSFNPNESHWSNL